jgi:hypothetical protein
LRSYRMHLASLVPMRTVQATSAPHGHVEPAEGGNLVWADPIWTYRAVASTLIKARELRFAAIHRTKFLA